jgi:hypothetical protein
VPAKKTKKPARSIKYLLSANPKLQRISLRKISPAVEHARKPSSKSQPSEPAYGRRALVLLAICVLMVGALIAANRPTRQADVAASDAQPQLPSRIGATAPPQANAAADRLKETVRPDTPKKAAVTGPAASAAPAETHQADATATPAARVEPVKTQPADSAAVAESPVSITGCLETSEDTFWLKDTSGSDIPRSRSWKWGFLKKRSTKIELVDTSPALKLPNYVGQRVTATGVLTNGGGMKAQSLHPVASSCN